MPVSGSGFANTETDGRNKARSAHRGEGAGFRACHRLRAEVKQARVNNLILSTCQFDAILFVKPSDLYLVFPREHYLGVP
jgi:hypothetical protein